MTISSVTRFGATVVFALIGIGPAIGIANADDALNAQLDSLRQALAKHEDPYVAVRDLYLSTVGCVHYDGSKMDGHMDYPKGAMGIHFVNLTVQGPLFAPYGATSFAIADGPFAGSYPYVPVPGAAPIITLPYEELNGPVVYGGYGCPDSAPIPTPDSIPGYLGSLTGGEEKPSCSSAGQPAIRAPTSSFACRLTELSWTSSSDQRTTSVCGLLAATS